MRFDLSEHVRSNLESRVKLDYLPVKAWHPQVDAVIFSCLSGFLIETLEQTYGNKVTATGDSLFIYENQSYVVKSNLIDSEIFIEVYPLFNKGAKLKRKQSAKLIGLGKYQKISIKLAERIGKIETVLLQSAITIIQASYAWLNYRLEHQIQNIQNVLAHELYELLFSIIPLKAVYHCWFWAVVGDKGFYLTDSQARVKVAENINRFGLINKTNPSSLYVNFTTSLLSFEKTVSLESFQNETDITIAFTDTKYQESGVPIAEEAAYGNSIATCIPLVNQQRVKLSMGVPRHVANEISPYIKSNISLFDDFVTRNSLRFETAVEALNDLIDGQIHKETWDDYIDLNINFYGIGVKGNKIVKRLLNKKK